MKHIDKNMDEKLLVILCMIIFALVGQACYTIDRFEYDRDMSMLIPEMEIHPEIHYYIEDAIKEVEANRIGDQIVVFNGEIPLNDDIINLCESEASRIGVPTELFFSMIYKESRFNPDAIGKNETSFDVGYMQINNRNFDWIDKLHGYDVDAYNSYDNVSSGIKIFEYYYNRTEGGYSQDERIIRALNKYNMGEAGYRRYCESNGWNRWHYGKSIVNMTKEDM